MVRSASPSPRDPPSASASAPRRRSPSHPARSKEDQYPKRDLKRNRYEDRHEYSDRYRKRDHYASRGYEEEGRSRRDRSGEVMRVESRRYEGDSDRRRSEERFRSRDRHYYDPHDSNGRQESRLDAAKYDGESYSASRRRHKSPPPSSSRQESSSSARSAPRSAFEVDRRRERERYDAASGSASSSRNRDPSGASEQHREDPTRQGGPQEEEEEDLPDFKPSGLLAKESNQINGTALKYHEPPEAKKPKKKWRLYVFKNGQEVDLLHLSRQSCYLFGRDKAVVDVPLEHTSCSKQHAVLQYRLTIERNEFGDEKRNIKPYLIDLASANGTTVNKRDVPASRYYELKNGDTIQFAGSEREYVLLCED